MARARLAALSMILLTGLGCPKVKSEPSCDNQLEAVERILTEKSDKTLSYAELDAIIDGCPGEKEESLKAKQIVQKAGVENLNVPVNLLALESIDLSTQGKLNLSGVLVGRRLNISSGNFEAVGSIFASESASVTCDTCDIARARFYGSAVFSLNGRKCDVTPEHKLVCDAFEESKTSVGPVFAVEPNQEKERTQILPVPKYVYIHVAAINNWFELLSEIMTKIVASGLYDKVSEVRIGYLGDRSGLYKLYSLIGGKEKIRIRYSDTNLGHYERATLNALYADSRTEDFYALYLHVKGVTKVGTNMYGNVMDWVNYMHYFTIERHADCIWALENEEISAVGVNLRSFPELHYSGNMWWAKSSYLRTLRAEIGPDYLDPEMWPLSGSGNFLSKFTTNFNHYHSPFPNSNYLNKEMNLTVVNY